MKNANKGFTLIELLAVIVILAIIALIATPVVLGIIEKAKLRTVELSGLNYVDAIEKQIVLNMMEVDGQIKDGVYDYDDINVSLKGQIPDSGWFIIEKGQVSNYSFVINGYVVTKGSKTKKGDTAADKYKTYTLGQLVYFDPVSTAKCDENSTSETCYKWRVIETADSGSKPTITLQMDHNLINESAWESSDSNIKGPVTALTELNEKTKTWLRVEPLNYEYDTSAATNNYGKMKCTNGKCTLNGTAVAGIAKARMITGEEVRDITNTKVRDLGAISRRWTVASSGDYDFAFSFLNAYIGTKDDGEGNTDLKWLIENTYDYDLSGATSNGIDNDGYWTLSPVSDRAGEVWLAAGQGGLVPNSFQNVDIIGVRPVITVLKYKI